jgi:hypothetical protein
VVMSMSDAQLSWYPMLMSIVTAGTTDGVQGRGG